MKCLNYNSICFQLTGDETWAKVTVEAVNHQCKTQLKNDVTLFVGGKPPEDVLGAICPNDCSGNGACLEGTLSVAFTIDFIECTDHEFHAIL